MTLQPSIRDGQIWREKVGIEIPCPFSHLLQICKRGVRLCQEARDMFFGTLLFSRA